MKLRMKNVFVALLILLILTSCSPRRVTNSYNAISVLRKEILSSQVISNPSNNVDGMQLVTQKGHVAMYADMETGYFAIEDLRNGKLWYSNPVNAKSDEYVEGIYKNWLYSQVILTLVDPATSTTSTKNSYTSSVKKHGITVKTSEEGIQVTYEFVKEGVSLTAYYQLTDDGFFAAVDTETIVETGSNDVYNIKLLPMFGAQYYGQDGWILVPDGSGALINFNDKRALGSNPYRVKIYGNDPVIPAENKSNFQEIPMLPVLGLHTGDGGLLMVADDGAANAYANGVCSRQLTGYNNAYFDFDTRITENSVIGDIRSWNYKQVVTYEKGSIASGTAAVRYIILQQNESSLTQMAKVMRQYILVQRNDNETVSDKAPVFLDVLCGTKQKKSIMGVPVKVTRSMTTLDQASAMSKVLNQDGVNGIHLSLQQWSNSLINGKITTGIDINSKLGTKTKLSDLSKQLQKTSGSLYLQTAFNFYTNAGNGISKNGAAIRDLNGAVSKQPRYLKDVYYPSATGITDRILNAFSAVKSAEAFVRSLTDEFQNIGVEISDLGNVLGGDYSDGGLRRQDTETYFRETISELSKKTALIGKATNLYGLYDLSALYCLPDTASEYQVVSHSVPFMQLTLRGIMDIGSRPINSSGSYQRAFLLCIATGISPTYELIYDMPLSLKGTDISDYYGSDFKAWEPIIAKQYGQYAKLYEATKGAEIIDYTVLDSGLIKTTYSNNVITLVNTGDTSISTDGVVVEANNFALLTGGDLE